VELANLRGDLSRDLGDIKTACAVLVERSNRVEQDVRDLRSDTEADAAALRAEVEELKRNRWPLPALGAVTGLGSLGVALYALVAR
jgi:hypothetical protein